MFAPGGVCWTEAPGTMGGLRNQRVRWHAGLLDNLRMHLLEHPAEVVTPITR